MANVNSIILLVLLLLPFSSYSSTKGKRIFRKCIGCHKKDGSGYKNRSLMKGPKIAGLDKDYIIEQVTAIKEGTRKSKYTGGMRSRVKRLSEKDIQEVATYVSSLGGK